MKFDVELRAPGLKVDRFIEVYYSTEFQARVIPIAKLRAREQVELTQLPDGRRRRRVRMVPDVDVPRPLRSLLEGEEIEYFEVTHYDPATRSATFDVESRAGDKLVVRGLVRFSDEERHARLHFTGEVRCSLFGVGGAVERYVAGEVAARYGRVQLALETYLRERPEG